MAWSRCLMGRGFFKLSRLVQFNLNVHLLVTENIQMATVSRVIFKEPMNHNLSPVTPSMRNECSRFLQNYQE